VDGGSLYAALPAETLALAGVGPDAPVALTVDHASAWRARDMVGAMVQGTGAIHVLDDLGSGAKTARALATSIDPEAGTLVRITPARLVWWKGWSSGSLAVEIDAPPERVWQVTSNPRNLPHWDKHIESVEVPDGGLALGVRYRVTMRFMALRTIVDAEVLEWEPPWRASIRLSGLLEATVTTAVASLPFDRSVLRHEITYRFRGPLGGLGAQGIQALGGSQMALKRGVLAQKREIEDD
jgi:carbon monoxide dehydrogenase subunit G